MPPNTSDPRIQLLKTSFVIYYHHDLFKAKIFCLDFGFRVAATSSDEKAIFFKGYGPDPFCYVARQAEGPGSTFGGAAWLVESRMELQKATKLPGASQIRILEAPGGGEIVTLKDPLGHEVHLIWGQEEKEVEDMELEKLVTKFENEKNRLGKFQRFKPGPAPVYKWGHYGVTYPDAQYEIIFDWYTRYLALAVSDIVYIGERPVTAFFHIDRGLEYTDHHAFFIKRAKPGSKSDVAHAAFEVHDFDIQQLGHEFLESKGYKLCWGIGRHVLGSQIFDYWFDTSGFILEHYADGDLVNKESFVSYKQVGPDALKIWGSISSRSLLVLCFRENFSSI